MPKQSPEIEAMIKRLANEMVEKIANQTKDDVAELLYKDGGTLGALFAINNVGDLKTFCKRAVLSKREFATYISGCNYGIFPWRHEILSRDYVPEHLNPTKEEMSSVAGAKAGDPLPKGLRKIMSILDQRRLLVGHIFYNHDLNNWHLLYFDQRDTTAYDNHWMNGSHIHLISWLMRPNQNADMAWKDFQQHNPKLSGKLYIRCKFS
jgi:hypothetical protein